jgi:signal peptidase II
MRRVLAFVAFALAITIDRLTKLWALRLPEPGPFLFGDILTTTHHHNFGLIANLPLPLPLIFVVVAAVMLLVISALRTADKKQDILDMIALALILGGAVSNLWDRITWGYVFDWILLFRTSIINVADTAVGLGLLLYIAHRWNPTLRNEEVHTPKS